MKLKLRKNENFDEVLVRSNFDTKVVEQVLLKVFVSFVEHCTAVALSSKPILHCGSGIVSLSLRNVYCCVASLTFHVNRAGGREGSELQFKFTHWPIENSIGTFLI